MAAKERYWIITDRRFHGIVFGWFFDGKHRIRVETEKNMRCGENSTILDLLRAWAEHLPEAIAIRAPGRRSLTYGALFGQVETVTKFLHVGGISRGDRIATVLPNGPETAVAFLGVASGAVCAPLNPSYSGAEFEFYLSDLNPKALLVQSGMSSTAIAVAKKRDIPVIELLPEAEGAAGTFSLRTDGQPLALRRDFPHADDVALILHTSGTTSRPKLVPLTHVNLMTSADNVAVTLQLTRNDRCLNIMPLFHIHGLVGGLLASVMSGGSVICPSDFHATEFFKWLEEFQPTWYTAVPTMHRAIIASANANAEVIQKHPLRFIRSSSAPLPQAVRAELEETFHIPVIEAYGMTEAAHQITSNPLPPLVRKSGSVGMATRTQVAVMDDAGNFVPTGTVGEIVLRGANVIRGYENDSETDQKAFTHGWFRTGDHGYLDEDGYLFLTGRIKDVINRGGEKIAPLEIDKALMAHQEILEAASFAVQHATLGEDVAAAVVVRDKNRVTEETIRDYLLKTLARFKVPSRLLIVDKIPKSATGKVLRSALAEIFADQLIAEFIAPKNDIELKLAHIYAEVLGIERVGASDNFFALGGDSLRANQVIARVRSIFGVNFSIATIFNESTVAELASEVIAAMRSSNEHDEEFPDLQMDE